MSETDFSTILQHLYLTASHLEATVARWLADVDEGRRRAEDHDIRAMRDLLKQAMQQKHRLRGEVTTTVD